MTSRVLAVLDCFDLEHTRLSLADISRRSGLPPATAHRLLRELVAGRLLVRRYDGRYEVGPHLWNLGQVAPLQAELREIAAPYLVEVYERSRDNVHLAVRDGTAALYVDRVVGRRSQRLLNRTGGRLPLHATGVGKVLLAHAPPSVVHDVLAHLHPYTRDTITDPARLSRELADVRRQGYAVTAGELTPGAASAAVPVFARAGGVLASLGVVTGGDRRSVAGYAPLLRAAATALSRDLPADAVADRRMDTGTTGPA